VSVTSFVKKAAASVVSGAALALSLGAVHTASADTANLAKNHHVVYSTSFHVTQNNGTVNYDRWSGPSDHLGKYIIMDSLYSGAAQTTSAYDQFNATEIDDAGTIAVKTTQSLDFWPGEEVRSSVNVTIAPNTTRSFWIDTVNKWNDSVKTLVTIQNVVH
jgi:hypothetical protein